MNLLKKSVSEHLGSENMVSDFVKNRMQAHTPEFNNTWHGISRKIYKFAIKLLDYFSMAGIRKNSLVVYVNTN